MKKSNSGIQIVAAIAAAVVLLLRGSASAFHQPPPNSVCCQASCDTGPMCDMETRDDCVKKGGTPTTGSCNSTTQLCDDTPVCCSEPADATENEKANCSDITAAQCDGKATLGELCDAKGTCRDCVPEGKACREKQPEDQSPVFDTDACCAGTATCTIVGILPVPCALAIANTDGLPVSVFTCTCNPIRPYGYADAASLNPPSSHMLTMLYGVGAFGLLLPTRRRKRRR